MIRSFTFTHTKGHRFPETCTCIFKRQYLHYVHNKQVWHWQTSIGSKWLTTAFISDFPPQWHVTMFTQPYPHWLRLSHSYNCAIKFTLNSTYLWMKLCDYNRIPSEIMSRRRHQAVSAWLIKSCNMRLADSSWFGVNALLTISADIWY